MDGDSYAHTKKERLEKENSQALIHTAEDKLIEAQKVFQLGPSGRHQYVFFIGGIQYQFSKLTTCYRFIQQHIIDAHTEFLKIQKTLLEKFKDTVVSLEKIIREKNDVYFNNKHSSDIQFEEHCRLFHMESQLRKEQEALLQQYKNFDSNNCSDNLLIYRFLNFFSPHFHSSFNLKPTWKYRMPFHMKRFSPFIVRPWDRGLYETNIKIYDVNASNSVIENFTEKNISSSLHVCKTYTVKCNMEIEVSLKIGKTGYFVGQILKGPYCHTSTHINQNYAFCLVDNIRQHIDCLKAKEKKYEDQVKILFTQEKEKALTDLLAQLDKKLTEMKENTANTLARHQKTSEMQRALSALRNNAENSQTIRKHTCSLLRLLSTYHIFHVKTHTERVMDTLIEEQKNISIHK